MTAALIKKGHKIPIRGQGSKSVPNINAAAIDFSAILNTISLRGHSELAAHVCHKTVLSLIINSKYYNGHNVCVMQGLVSGKLKVEIEDNEVAVAALERVNIETLLMDTTKQKRTL